MANSDLYRWLRKKPLPSSIRCTDEDGKVRTIAVTPGRGTWLHMEESIRAVKATSVEALDEKGDLLRACDLESAGSEDESEEGDAPKKSAKAAQHETARLLEANSKSIVDAYTAGANANKSALEQVLSALSTLSEHFSDALSNMNALAVQNAKTLTDTANAAKEEPKSESDKALGVVMDLVQHKMQGGRVPSPEKKKKEG